MNINNLLNINILIKKTKSNYLNILSENKSSLNTELKLELSLVEEKYIKDIAKAIELCGKNINLDINNPLPLYITDKRENDYQLQVMDLNEKKYYVQVSEDYRSKIISSLKTKKNISNISESDFDLYFHKLLNNITNKVSLLNNKEYKSNRELELKKSFECSILKVQELIKIESRDNYNKNLWLASLNCLSLTKDYLKLNTNNNPDLNLFQKIELVLQKAEYIKKNNLFGKNKSATELEKREILDIFKQINNRFSKNFNLENKNKIGL